MPGTRRLTSPACRKPWLPRTPPSLAVEQAAVVLLDTPATTLVAIRLKLVVLLAKHAPGAADRNEAPWSDLCRLLVDLDRVLAL